MVATITAVIATTLGTAVSAAQAAAVFKHATDKGPTVVVTTMATTLVTAVSATLAAAMFKDD